MKLRNVDALRLFAVCGALGGFGLLWALLVGRANFAQAGNKAAPAIVGLPDDWTHRHVVFTNSGRPQVMERARQDPRYWLQQLKRHGAAYADVFNLQRGAPLIPRGVLTSEGAHERGLEYVAGRRWVRRGGRNRGRHG